MNIKALIVDDDRIHLKLLKNYLLKLECDSILASNGQEAVDIARKQTFDICFMDIQMPVMDGISASKIIKSEVAPTLPIIATTTLTDFDYDKSIAAGMDDYLKKPVDFSALRTVVEKHAGTS